MLKTLTDAERVQQRYVRITGDQVILKPGDLIQMEDGTWEPIVPELWGEDPEPGQPYARKWPDHESLPVLLVNAAIQHSEDAGEDHWKGDLEDCLNAMFDLIPGHLIRNLFDDKRIQNVLTNLTPQ